MSVADDPATAPLSTAVADLVTKFLLELLELGIELRDGDVVRKGSHVNSHRSQGVVYAQPVCLELVHVQRQLFRRPRDLVDGRVRPAPLVPILHLLLGPSARLGLCPFLAEHGPGPQVHEAGKPAGKPADEPAGKPVAQTHN